VVIAVCSGCRACTPGCDGGCDRLRCALARSPPGCASPGCAGVASTTVVASPQSAMRTIPHIRVAVRADPVRKSAPRLPSHRAAAVGKQGPTRSQRGSSRFDRRGRQTMRPASRAGIPRALAPAAGVLRADTPQRLDQFGDCSRACAGAQCGHDRWSDSGNRPGAIHGQAEQRQACHACSSRVHPDPPNASMPDGQLGNCSPPRRETAV